MTGCNKLAGSEDGILQVIIWGTGRVLEKYKKLLCLRDVICFVDSDNRKQGTLLYGKKIISPNELSGEKFDFIVIFSEKYYAQIAKTLTMEMGISNRKILNWQYYLKGRDGLSGLEKLEIFNMIKALCRQYYINRLLDIGMFMGNAYFWGDCEEIILDGIKAGKDMILPVCNQYRKIWPDSSEITENYELAILLGISECDTEEWIKKSMGHADNILFFIPPDRLDRVKECLVFNFRGSFFGIYRKEKETLKIYEVTHKKFIPVIESAYSVLQAGAQKKEVTGYLCDDTGDNISAYNSKINECTALYWIWKNTNERICGLNHYRRFFKSPVNGYSMLQEWEIRLLMDRYDIVVAKPVYFNGITVRSVLYNEVTKDAFDSGWKALMQIFRHKSEAEEQAFDYVFMGNMFYPCNMIITRKEILNKYCSWLFPILFQMMEEVEIKDSWDRYSKRIIGFFAERLLTVWLVQNNYRIKELPVILVGDEGAFGKEG